MSTEEPQEDADEDLRYFVRIGGTDLDGTKSVERALAGMDGIGRRSARIIARSAGVDRHETLGRLDDDVIDDIVEEVEGYGNDVPTWLTNRRKDFFGGDDRHVVGNDVELSRQQDVNRMQKIGSYKGIRHRRGQKVRGQRTKSTGRTEGTVGVNVERIREEEAEEAAEGE
ncbi:MAG TPA: 30S ribosomal protein S13 [Halobacteriales archaeon]|nr:30S ribosomal protein S13 [Halobacteriales archaeon]